MGRWPDEDTEDHAQSTQKPNMLHFSPLQRAIILTLLAIPSPNLTAWAQVDPISRELLEFGYDQPLKGRGHKAPMTFPCNRRAGSLSGWKGPPPTCRDLSSAAIGRPEPAVRSLSPRRKRISRSFCAMAMGSTPSAMATRDRKASACFSNTILARGGKNADGG
jgi:hypothetical protein